MNKNLPGSFAFVLSNARSLAPKITSLTDMIHELDLAFAAVTETWFSGGLALDVALGDIEQAVGIKFLCKNRRGKKRGGGVCLAFRKSVCNFKARSIKNAGSHELLCATGSVAGVDRKVAVFTVYIPPALPAAKFSELTDIIASEVAAVKISLKDPIIVLCGDMNGRDMSDALLLDQDIELLPSPPTRGKNTLDLVYSNVNRFCHDVDVRPPLTTEGGLLSDHGCVHVELLLPKTRNFTWVKKLSRKRFDSADQRFADELRQTDWTPMEAAGDNPDALVAHFETVVGNLTDKHFPLRSTRRRSNEDPWITNGIRHRAKRKKRIYKRHGKSAAWHRADERLQEEVRVKKQEFVESLIDMPDKNYYAAVQKLAGPNGKCQWSVTDLFPGDSPEVAGDKILDYFASVGGDEAPSRVQLPDGVRDAGLGIFDGARVLSILKSHKKTVSSVEGDPMPHLVQKFPDLFAAPVAMIFNAVNRSVKWPTNWKREHLTIIPKSSRPSSLAECRNISCTSLLSKVLENVLLERLLTELDPDLRQFGGVKKCGAEHLLIELWDRVLEALDGGDKAACLLGVDFEKAFNRMDHGACLRNLKALGASDPSIALVGAFLSQRIMTIKLCNQQCGTREILKCSPQGSVLGCLLYCAATQLLVQDLGTGGTRRPDVRIVPEARAAEELVPPPRHERGGPSQILPGR